MSGGRDDTSPRRAFLLIGKSFAGSRRLVASRLHHRARWDVRVRGGHVVRGDLSVSVDVSPVIVRSRIREGWKEMRAAVFAKREPGPPVEPSQWRERNLPPPTAQVVFCTTNV